MNLSRNNLSQALEFVSDEMRLQQVVDYCSGSAVLGIDTEFIRVNTYYPILGLIQLSDGKRCFLIDPLDLKDLSPLKSLFKNPNVTKVFHSCSEDLEVFEHHLGCLPEPVFDTQIAAAILGQGFSLSYQKLVMKISGVHLPKEETRSDWLQRPLSTSQCQYAAFDVAWLPQIYQQQRNELDSRGRLGWLVEECEKLSGMTAVNASSDAYYLRMKTAWKLDRQQLNGLKTLCAWREEEARKRDLPRNRVMDDKTLYNIARSGPQTRADLAALNLFPGQIRKYGGLLISLNQEAANADESLCPPLVERPAPPHSNGLLKELKQVVEAKADELGCAPEVLAGKRQLQAMLRSRAGDGRYHLLEVMTGWRKAAIGDALLERLKLDGLNQD